ncbi:nuclear prelamin A recognition factor [Pristis pectinata]|uniref:nuclear prelamin A recognition factor n=1 Tax=Pristis pectinata TaxID=685728 RepID=UPI00223D78BE|nr:nuclear prelamin A recognition factor [Pristis pectinata]XP_051889051.1 nuclear prelamin A recognition factor [Pristis pectinata]XP_051889052.1 nuclear prelamin A recognition factor [Pristis pectinata]XP_051889053.1 nuclear prelamin A recognition factor [Pristis pectinata]
MKCDKCTKKECSKKRKNDENESLIIDTKSPSDVDEESEFHKLANAKIFLSDCLACENCVTSTEGLRIAQQCQEFFSVLDLNQRCDESKHKVLVVSISPQSVPYFAAKHCIDVADVIQRLSGFLKSIGVHYVFNMTLAADFSLLESQREFVQRFYQRSQNQCALPMFASACPGWIRYAEKALGSLVLPHICTAKSPQQVMGSLIKDYFAKKQHLPPEKIFHAVITPCYDKKLEALGEDFYSSVYKIQDVDCVLTSGEIAQMMDQKGLQLMDVEPTASDNLFEEIGDMDITRHNGRGSDGFLEHIFKYAAKEIFGIEVKEIIYKTLRNKDFQEVTLEKDGEIVLRFAATYGFRNIQNMVHKLKKGKFPYHFVEVLACPGGCLNGKGQAMTEDRKMDKDLLHQMEEMYSSLPVRMPETNLHVQVLYQEWLEGRNSTKVHEVLHRQYHVLNEALTSVDIKW